LVAYELSANNRESAVTYTSGMDGAPCAANADCDNAHCIANVPGGTGSTCCNTACTPNNACDLAQCSTGTCTHTALSAGTCVVTSGGTQLSACSTAYLACGGAPADGDGDNLPTGWESSNNGAGIPYID